MEKSNGVFDGMDMDPTINDLFWKEKTQRMINECNSVSQLREIASLLLTVATQRQGVICGLMKKILLESKGPSLTPGLMLTSES
jgi:stage III sporulation protein SpoIIIAA